jgi:CheY-like chemotaxis protein
MTRQLRFLVVDDTEDIRDVMVRMVERAGHLAVQAADGVEATLALSEDRFDVMLLDLSMPRMSGEDVVRWLHAHPDRADGMRTVIVTAWAGDRRGTLQELGITTVLAKPFRRQHLIDLIADISAENHHRDSPREAHRST